MFETMLQFGALFVGFVVVYGVVMPPIRKVLDDFPDGALDLTDPTRHCQCYVEEGCSHVDGMLCNIKTCQILKDYKKDNHNA